MSNATDYQALTEQENDFLRAWARWGSDMYPITKVGNGRWLWTEAYGIKGAPTTYKTKRAACQAIEAYVGILRDKAAGRV